MTVENIPNLVFLIVIEFNSFFSSAFRHNGENYMKGIFIESDDSTGKLAEKLKFCCGIDTYKAVALDEAGVCSLVRANYEFILIGEEAYKSIFFELSTRLSWFHVRTGTIKFVKGFSVRRLYHICKADSEKMFPIELYTRELDENSIVDLFRRTLATEEKGLPVKLSRFFTKIGLSRTLRGYEYLIEASRLVAVAPELLGNLTKGLYPLIGNKFGVSGSVVERCIRNAVDSTMSKGKFCEVANSLYGGNFGKYEKPTNGEFISFISLI